MNNAQLINQTSGVYEYYSPLELVSNARLVMGSIDLDPASSATANERIKAADYYTEEMNGLTLPWKGNIWLNHPFSRKANPLWVNKLITEWGNGNITSACCITFAATSERWFQPLLQHPQCFLTPRTNYYLPDGTKKRGVTKGSVITYLGPRPDDFKQIFSLHGVVK